MCISIYAHCWSNTHFFFIFPIDDFKSLFIGDEKKLSIKVILCSSNMGTIAYKNLLYVRNYGYHRDDN